MLVITAAKVVNSLGLLFDLIGAFLLWYYALPSRLEEGVRSLLLLDSKVPDPAQQKKFDARAKLGLLLQMIGFGLQLLSNFL